MLPSRAEDCRRLPELNRVGDERDRNSSGAIVVTGPQTIPDEPCSLFPHIPQDSYET